MYTHTGRARLTRRAMSYWPRWYTADAFGQRALRGFLTPGEAVALERLETNLAACGNPLTWFCYAGITTADLLPTWKVLETLLAGLVVDAGVIPDLVRACRLTDGAAGLETALRAVAAGRKPDEPTGPPLLSQPERRKEKVPTVKPPRQRPVPRDTTALRREFERRRRELGLTLQDLANRSGLSTSTVHKLATGEPTRERSIVAVAQALQQDPGAWLVLAGYPAQGPDQL